MENRALGKGLSALIPQKREIIEDTKTDTAKDLISSLEIKSIKYNTLQPRKNYDPAHLEELKASIKEKGILQPLLVRPAGNGYEVVAGERRLRAAQALGLQQVPAVIKNVTDREALVLALVENIQRQELNPIEEAQGFKRLIEEFNFTQESVADSVGKDRSTITNLLRLLKLPAPVQDHIATERMSVGHARALLTLPERQQIEFAEKIVAKSWSVRQVEAAVKKAQEEKLGPTPKKVAAKDRDLQILEEDLSRSLGTKVEVDHKKDRGRLIIEYYSLDDLDRILEVIRK